METSISRILSLAVLPILAILLLTLAGSCAFGKYLKVETVSPADIKGTYTLFLYGGRYMDDYETIAVMAEEGTPYTFEIYAPDFNYKVKTGVPSDKALAEAKRFVSSNHDFYRVYFSKILDEAGNTIGYEVKPLYYPFYLRYSDVLDVAYKIQNQKVTVYIKLKPEVEKSLDSGRDRSGSQN
ncbi:MAG: hypothetical protein HQK89_13400 [Nitrospirae bacterium]|nr:hypothetical protein [Nitrospirota bacterium]